MGVFNDGIDYINPTIMGKILDKFRKNQVLKIGAYHTIYNVSLNDNGEETLETPSSEDDVQAVCDQIGKHSTGTAWSDRLWQQDSDKYNKLRMKHFGDHAQLWYTIDPTKTEEFLSDFFEKKVELMGVAHQENRSNGYPTWIFFFKDKV